MIDTICQEGREFLKEQKISIIYNSVGFTNKIDTAQEDSDFFSNKEIGEIFDALIREGATIIPFSNELEFVQQAVDGALPSNIIIWNLSRQGSDNNKKSLVTSLADFLNVNYIGSSVYTMNLCRHKYDFQKVIDSPLITTSASHFNTDYPDHLNFIIKPEKGSASRGMKNEWTNLNSTQVLDLIKSKEIQDNDLIQQYVRGFEIEVPLIQYKGKFSALGIAGIQIGEKTFLDSEILEEEMYETKYKFYDFKKDIKNDKLCEAIIAEAIRIAELTEIKDYGRVDFRVDFRRNFYCFDIATTPYLTEHSSFNFLIKQNELSHPNLLSLIIGSCRSNIEGQ